MMPFLDLLVMVQKDKFRKFDQLGKIDNYLLGLDYARTRQIDEDVAAGMLEDLQRTRDDWATFRGDPDQWDKFRACDYDDNLFSHGTDNENAYTDYYICQNVGTTCLTLAQADKWGLKYEDRDPWAEGQQWYCPSCGKKYKTALGKICELKIGNTLTYMWSPIPEQNIINWKCMIIERTLKAKETATEMYACIPKAIEMPEGGFTPIVGTAKQCYTIDRDFFSKLPEYDWMQIFRLVTGEEPPSVNEMKSQVRAANKPKKSAAAQAGPWV